ncbi:bifunctional DNA-formamidopyrimidine glycosylase/DNA-(apurinic or apyrimidinic site) lyase [Patescibacteria group bacterium]|nr:bifunctional DNA-formamidopyrimidine glycosylase/DNA-(apurinic or apyrimidinic site) lyase [Patescibacteria group bacterium]
MPELPEVETIRRQLDKVLVGQKIKEIEKLHPKSLQGNSLKVLGKKIVAVKRKAKMIWIDLEGDLNLLIHLKMTGQLIYNGRPGKHTRVVFGLSRGRLIFNDMRLFGWIRVVNNQQLKSQFAKLPPDVVDTGFTQKYLETILKSSRRAVKLVLLDQQKMGGVGNIYANEALFYAGIDPRRPANKIIGREVRNLHKCLRQVINRGIKYGGSTASDENFVNALGQPGRFQNQLLVYENKTVCRRCGAKIIKIKLGGRGTYFCPVCQK